LRLRARHACRRGAIARQTPARRSDGAAGLDQTATHQTRRPAAKTYRGHARHRRSALRTATFFAFRLWHRFRNARWRQLVSRGIVPLTIGLVIAGARRRQRLARPGADRGDRGADARYPVQTAVAAGSRRDSRRAQPAVMPEDGGEAQPGHGCLPRLGGSWLIVISNGTPSIMTSAMPGCGA
jgi:hypothetical protein